MSLKAGDNISTDDITPANAALSSMPSNIPLIAEYAYSRYDPDFAAPCKWTLKFYYGAAKYSRIIFM